MIYSTYNIVLVVPTEPTSAMRSWPPPCWIFWPTERI